MTQYPSFLETLEETQQFILRFRREKADQRQEPRTVGVGRDQETDGGRNKVRQGQLRAEVEVQSESRTRTGLPNKDSNQGTGLPRSVTFFVSRSTP